MAIGECKRSWNLNVPNSNSSSGCNVKVATNKSVDRSQYAKIPDPTMIKSHVGHEHESRREPGKVRLAVRLRPTNAEETSVAAADSCVELEPDLNILKLRKNNWDSETYDHFDHLLTPIHTQKHVYDVVAKPVVESVLNGCNGSLIAYGQRGSGKTFTLAGIGDNDTAERGIMVRAMEDIISNEHNYCSFAISVSFLRIYMDTVYDLLNPTSNSIPIPVNTMNVPFPLRGATTAQIRDKQSFIELLRAAEANRSGFCPNTGSSSSSSHGIMIVNIRRERWVSVSGKQKDKELSKAESKLVVVDLAASDLNGHSDEEAKSIDISLGALGKCINALGQNTASSHNHISIPVGDSTLTRVLGTDLFGSSARTALILTIGACSRHREETARTIMFGKKAINVNFIKKHKLKQQQLGFDYKKHCSWLEKEVDKLSVEKETLCKELENFGRKQERELREAEERAIEAEKRLVSISQGKATEKSRYIEILQKMEEVQQVKKLLQKETQIRERVQWELQILKQQRQQQEKENAGDIMENNEILKLVHCLEDVTKQRRKLEDNVKSLKHELLVALKAREGKGTLEKGEGCRSGMSLVRPDTQLKKDQQKASANGKKAIVPRKHFHPGLQNILQTLDDFLFWVGYSLS